MPCVVAAIMQHCSLLLLLLFGQFEEQLSHTGAVSRDLPFLMRKG